MNMMRLTDSGAKGVQGNRLDEDYDRGFKIAVANGQTRLALDYAVQIIAELREDIRVLQGSNPTGVSPMEEVRESVSNVQHMDDPYARPEAKKAPRKVVKKAEEPEPELAPEET